jgi:hypothetical protein
MIQPFRRLLPILAGACALALAMPAPARADQTLLHPDLSVDGSAFVLHLPNGRVLRGAELQGAKVVMPIEGGRAVEVRLSRIEPDPRDPGLLRHAFEMQDAQGQWVPACQPNADGETWGFPIALPEGHPGREGPITLTCVSGAVGKCARFGYQPWKRGPHGEDLLPYHAACVRMVRADYGGDGAPHTRNGTRIDIYDAIGIQRPDSLHDAEYAFEAGWSPAGAVCVARTRWGELATMEDLRAQYPRLPLGSACTESAAAAAGALLFNRSRLAPRVGQ